MGMMLKLLFYAFGAGAILQRVLEAKHHPKVEGEIQYAWTLKYMTLAHLFCFIGAVVEWTLKGALLNVGLLVLGGGLFALGFVLRQVVRQTLGRYWSVHIELRKDQPLIQTGIYRYCRHPNYLAILIEITGYALVFQAYIVMGFSLILYALAIGLRVRFEEQELIAKYGDAYREYKRKTKAFLPYVI